jgi:hypothetical protein
MDDRAQKVAESPLFLAEIPVQPGELVVLAVCVIVALLGVTELVAGQEHGHALRQYQGGEKVALLLPAQGIHARIVSGALSATVPIVVVAHQIVEVKAVVAGDEVDAGRGFASIVPVACSENNAKFTPLPSQVAPSGYEFPGQTRMISSSLIPVLSSRALCVLCCKPA